MDQTTRVIVKFKPIPEDSDDTIESLCEEIRSAIPKGELIRRPSASGRAVFSVDPGVDVVQLAHELSKQNTIDYAEPDIVDSEA